MALSFEQYTGDGTTKTFSVTFSYLDRAHVEVKVNGVAETFTWDDDSTVRLSTAPANGAVVDVRRKTPRDNRLVDFNDGSVLTEKDLDLANIQTFYIVQEAIDIAGGTLLVEPDGSYSANLRRIGDLGDPVNPGDAINKGYHDGTFIPEMNTIKNDTITAKDAAVTAKNDAVTAKDTAVSSKNAAATSETNAGLWENNAYKFAEEAKDVSFTTNISNGGPFYSAKHYSLKADDARAAAVTAKNAAQTAESNAATSATNASNSASSASTSATNASNSASAAATSETNAATSETNALAHENKAFDWANSLTSLTHPSVSGTFYSAAVWATATNLGDGSAKMWATTAPGTTVGTTGEYSAKHYADQAATYAAGLSLPAIDGTDGGKMLRVKDDTTGYQLMTPAATRTHIGAEQYRHYARIHTNGLNQAVANNTWTRINFRATNFDTAGGVVDLASDRFTVPSGARFVRIEWEMVWAGDQTGQRAYRLNKNGSNIVFGQYVPIYNAGRQCTSGIVDVVGGDYFDIDVLQSSGATLNLQGAFASIEIIF